MSGTPQLRSLTLHLLSFPRSRSYLGLPPPPDQRIVLATLSNLKYQGTSKYLDVFVAGIEAPRLRDIEITLFNQPTMDTSQLGRFIGRTEIHTSLIQADVVTSSHAISISFTNSSTSTPLRLQISCKQLDWQLSCMAQVCDQVSPFLFHVIDLGLNTTQPLYWQGDVNGEQWLDLVRSFKFSGAKSFSMASQHTREILCVLCSANEGNTTMLPSLHYVSVQEPMEMDGPSWDSVQSFITSRSISGRPVEVKASSYQCHICRVSSEEQQVLKRHLRDKHGYQILCSYCDDFESTPGQRDLFREHIEERHPEIARSDPHISKLSLTHFQIDSLVNRHTSLRAPDVVPSSPSSESTKPYSPLPIAWDSDLDYDSWTSDTTSDNDSATSY